MQTRTRREFLRTASAMAGLALPLTSARPVTVEFRASRVLVLVHLEGGNDGLNTVVPWRDPEYYRLRPTIAVPPAHLIPITPDLAFNGRFEDVARLYRDGRVAVVLGVGNPNASRSHFREAEAWRTATALGGEYAGDSLHDAAERIREGSSGKACRVTVSGFDTHTNQPARHGRLLEELGRSLAEFQERLRRDGTSPRVLTVVYSEFGRRPEENASGGTDHGTAGPVFLIGDGVAGGIHRTAPRLDDLDRGDLKHTVDFRAVCAAALRNWLGEPSAATASTLPLLA